MDQILQLLESLLGSRYWRVGLIIGVALVVAVFLRLIVMPLLVRLSRRTASQVDDQILDRVNPAILRTVLLEGIHWAALDFFSDATVHKVVNGLVVSLLVLMWGRVLMEAASVLFRRASEREGRLSWIQPQTLPLIQFSLKVLVISTQAYFIMTAWHINLTSWLASAGVVGIAVGFAAKDTLANFISGVFILIDAPYQVGQYIVVDSQTRGVVTDIGMRSTRLLTRDNIEISVPNAIIGNSMVVNESSGPSPRMRVRAEVSVAYGSEVETVRSLLQACTVDLPHTCADMEGVVRFTAMGESSLQFTVMTWVEYPEFRGRVLDMLNTRIYQALGAAGVQIPFPQQDIYIKSWPGPPVT